MNSTDSGHAKNVATYFDFLSKVVTFGVSYNPPTDRLSVESLALAVQRSNAAMANYQSAENRYRSKRVERSVLFDNIATLSININELVATCGLDSLTTDTVFQLVDKICSDIKSKNNLLKEALMADSSSTCPTVAKPIRFDKLTEKVGKLLVILNQTYCYKANEKDLMRELLSKLHAKLVILNSDVLASYMLLEVARQERHRALYTDMDSIYLLTRDVKSYVLAAYGDYSREYAMIKGCEMVYDVV
jgi:ATP-dependent protease HslVU (ClpYQ) peptidase subunit